MWLSSQKFYSLCEKKTNSFLQSLGKWWLVFGSPLKSILLRTAWEGNLWGGDKWVEYTSIQTCFFPPPIFLPPKPHSKWDTAQNTLRYKTGSQHCSFAIGKRSFFPLPIWQSSRTLLVVTEDLREPAEAHGSWVFPERLFCWEERQESIFKEENRVHHSSARIKE